MSLEDKLKEVSENLKKSKEQKKIEAQEEELKPVRARIKELENIKYQLELVEGSLRLKSDSQGKDKIGKGMREHSAETEQLAKEKFSKLQKLAEQLNY